MENQVKGLEEERSALRAELTYLREKVMDLGLQEKLRSLSSEVSALRSEKVNLEQEIAGYTTVAETPATQTAPEIPVAQ